VRAKFASHELRIVCNVGILTTGIDWDVRCIILARPTRSRILFTQIVGRGLRNPPGKDHCLILDHSDNHLRLGFVTDPVPQTLDDGVGPRRDERSKDEPLPTECTSCGFPRCMSARTVALRPLPSRRSSTAMVNWSRFNGANMCSRSD
jgi:DNA repair protein RadD